MLKLGVSTMADLEPTDPRHGTMKGHAQGCRDLCCRRAKARYEKHRRYNAVTGVQWAIPALGSQRRIQALLALGWTTTDIAHAAGWTHRNRVRQILAGQKGKPTTWVTRSTAATVSRVYDQWCMTIPEMTMARRRSRTMALQLGYVPPLAWDDIDTDERPRGAVGAGGPDLVVIERILAGEYRLEATADERRAVIARWPGSLAGLARLTGWNVHRDRRSAA